MCRQAYWMALSQQERVAAGQHLHCHTSAGYQFKIKVDVPKETDWKLKFAGMKNKLSEEAEQPRRKTSRRGK
jgi:hypothetical protein